MSLDNAYVLVKGLGFVLRLTGKFQPFGSKTSVECRQFYSIDIFPETLSANLTLNQDYFLLEMHNLSTKKLIFAKCNSFPCKNYKIY
jgi:hypothetical protein